jgi:opacity protein-like surface antigen
MMNLQHSRILTTSIASLCLMGIGISAQAQDFYVSGSVGQGFPGNVNNQGAFTSPFTTGQVTGVNPPLTLPAGDPVSWRTNLNNGEFWSLAAGMKSGALRYEAEYTWSKFGVSSHRGVNAGGIDLSNIDAGVLLTGNVGDLGLSVANLLASDSGDFDTTTLMVNVYYDFDTGTKLTPYVGLGLGWMNVELTYRPGDVGVIRDDDNVFAYQLIGGLNYEVNDRFSVFTSYRYRDNRDATVRSSLLPASLGYQGTGCIHRGCGHTLFVLIRPAGSQQFTEKSAPLS